MPDADGAPPLAPDELQTIARLAHLDLTLEEHERMTRDFAQILGYLRQLDELEVSSVPPTAHVQLDRLALRADELHHSLPHDVALREAPVVAGEGFAVPAFVDEG